MMKQSEKDISERLDISVSKIDRKLTEISSHTVLRHASLPKSMNWDIDLNKYFRRYSKSERDKVKHISIDFYSGYIFLAKRLFKNENISIDRFHIVIQAYNALNTTKVKLCYKCNPNYNKLKDYWKLIVKNENDLNDKKNILKTF